MRIMARWKYIILCSVLFMSMILPTLAASATSFCKCTCFGKSVIIELDGNSKTSPASPGKKSESKKVHGTCLDCNRKFCLDYNLPICKGAKEEDFFTTCFQRDSAKDEAVVFIFIFATVGLLVYAGIKPWMQRWSGRFRERQTYSAVNTAAAEES